MNKHFPILFISFFVALQCIAQQQKLSPIAQIYLNKKFLPEIKIYLFITRIDVG